MEILLTWSLAAVRLLAGSQEESRSFSVQVLSLAPWEVLCCGCLCILGREQFPVSLTYPCPDWGWDPGAAPREAGRAPSQPAIPLPTVSQF